MSGISIVSSEMLLLLKKIKIDGSSYVSLRKNESTIRRIANICKIMPEYITVKTHNGEYSDKTALDCWNILIDTVNSAKSHLEIYYSTLKLMPIISSKLESEPKLSSEI